MLVPIKVHVPPKIDENESGMKSCAGEILHFRHHFWTIGIIIATTGVLFKNAETMAMGIINLNCASATDLGFPNSFPM